MISHCHLQPIKSAEERDYLLSVSGLSAEPTIRGVKGAVCRMFAEEVFEYFVKENVLWIGKLLYITLRDIVLRTYWIRCKASATVNKACP